MPSTECELEQLPIGRLVGLEVLQRMSAFTRDVGTPRHYSLVNRRDWGKNHILALGRAA